MSEMDRSVSKMFWLDGGVLMLDFDEAIADCAYETFYCDAMRVYSDALVCRIDAAI